MILLNKKEFFEKTLELQKELASIKIESNEILNKMQEINDNINILETLYNKEKEILSDYFNIDNVENIIKQKEQLYTKYNNTIEDYKKKQGIIIQDLLNIETFAEENNYIFNNFNIDDYKDEIFTELNILYHESHRITAWKEDEEDIDSIDILTYSNIIEYTNSTSSQTLLIDKDLYDYISLFSEEERNYFIFPIINESSIYIEEELNKIRKKIIDKCVENDIIINIETTLDIKKSLELIEKNIWEIFYSNLKKKFNNIFFWDIEIINNQLKEIIDDMIKNIEIKKEEIKKEEEQKRKQEELLIERKKLNELKLQYEMIEEKYNEIEEKYNEIEQYRIGKTDFMLYDFILKEYTNDWELAEIYDTNNNLLFTISYNDKVSYTNNIVIEEHSEPINLYWVRDPCRTICSTTASLFWNIISEYRYLYDRCTSDWSEDYNVSNDFLTIEEWIIKREIDLECWQLHQIEYERIIDDIDNFLLELYEYLSHNKMIINPN